MNSDRTLRPFRLAAALLMALLLPASAQGQGAANHVQWKATAQPQSVTPGDTVKMQLEAQIAEGWKMYALDSPRPSWPVQPALDSLPAGFAAQSDWQQAAPQEGYDPNFDKTVRYFAGRATLWKPLQVQAGASPGTRTLKGQVRYMICNKKMCLPPTPASFNVAVDVQSNTQGSAVDSEATPTPDFTEDRNPLTGTSDSAATPAAPGAAAGDGAVGTTRGPGSTRVGGLWGFLLLAVGAGAAALLTPCVLPMIPLTVSYFTKHAGNRSASFRMALVYGGAIVLTFTGLGVLTALLVGAAGAQTMAANPWVNLFIGLIFVLFALSLLGLFELRLPQGLLNYFNRQSSERSGYAGVLFMGLTLTFVSFSCTAPFVGGLLAATAQGSWSEPVLGMLVFSATFSLPFMLFALFPNALGALPNSGSWMGAVKVVLGFVELAAALKFLSNADLIWGWGLISRPLAIALTVVIFFLTGLYLLGKLSLRHEPAVEQVGVGRLLFAIGFFGLSLYLLPGLLGAPLGRLDAYLPPRQAGDVSLLAASAQSTPTRNSELDWHEDIDAAFAEARQENQPVFVDFTGYTCTNCREMEANVFPKPEVARRFKNDFVLLRLYTDAQDRGPAFQRYQLRLTGTVALPTYAIVSPRDKQQLIAQVSGLQSPDAFAAFLEHGASSFREGRLALR